MKCLFKHQALQMLGLKLPYVCNLNPDALAVVGRGSESQLQVGKNLNNFWGKRLK